MTILTVDEFRDFVETDLVDSALQVLLDSAEEAILAYAGPPLEVTQLVDGGVARLAMTRPVASVSSITELYGGTTTTLAADDYRIRADGLVIERLRTGTNPHGYWHGFVTLTYVPLADTATRQAVQVELVKIDLATQAGSGTLRSQTIGDFSESFGTDNRDPQQQRSAALARLNPEPMMAVVGYPHFSIAG